MANYAFVPACLLSFLAGLTVVLLTQWRRDGNSRAAKMNKDAQRTIPVYGLSHAILNLQVPPTTMWMNMGYWNDQKEYPADFPRACVSLLRKVLAIADVSDTTINLLDVGFGCGDQTIELLRRVLPGGAPKITIMNYVGITNSKKQFAFAEHRLKAQGILGQDGKEPNANNVRIFCSDAARPSTWDAPLSNAVRNFRQAPGGSWLLGLDTLYHFSPSRLELLISAHDAGASFMAFDLLRGEEMTTFFARTLLRIVCLLTSTPYNNLMTRNAYQAMLVAAGYNAERITFVDISDDVFDPLARFLNHQNTQLGIISKGIGPYHVAKWVFAWWARTGIVRGYVVVARH